MKARIINFLALLWRFIVWTWSILIVGIIVGILGNAIYTYLQTGNITLADPRTLTIIIFLRSYPYQALFTLTLIIILTICAYLANLLQKEKLKDDAQHLPATADSQSRQRMLTKVRTFWITGVLEHSLHGAALIVLGLREQADAVAKPWRLVLHQDNRPAHELPPNTSITQVFDDAGGELLILGEPGSGKTTLLLQLARDLLDRAKLDNTHQIPVVFNLSWWALKRQPLINWLIEELKITYQVPHRLGKDWIKNDQVLLLLDGLDEVAKEYRSACIDAIKEYRKEHGLVPIVVCSRSVDYYNENNRLLLHSAVVLQPLTTQQINDYLASAGDQLAAVRIAIDENPGLQRLAATPLMLSLLTLAYYGMPIDNSLIKGTLMEQQQKVLANYVQRMLHRQSATASYTSQLTIDCVTWLAKRLIEYNQTKLPMRWMETPKWLLDSNLLKVDQNIIVVLMCALAIGFGCDLVSGGLGAIIGALGAILIIGPTNKWFGNQIRAKIMELFGKLDLKSAALFGCFFTLALIFIMIIGIILTAIDTSLGILPNWLTIIWLMIGMLIWFYIIFQITIPRILLWRKGYLPLNYSHFLNHAVNCTLLRRVGDSYFFIHQLLFEYFASLDPETSIQYSFRGDLYRDLKDYERALTDYARAIQLKPNKAHYYNRRGHVYDKLEQFEQAVADYSRAIQLDPDEADYYYFRGEVYYDLEQFEQAVADYSRAIQLDPNDQFNFSSRGKAYYELKQFEHAIADFSRAIKLDPNEADYYFNRGEVYDDLEQYEQAIADFSCAIKLDPNDEFNYFVRGKAFYKLKQSEQAIVDFSHAIQLKPNNSRYYNWRGLVYDNLEQYEQALADYSQAIQLEPKLLLPSSAAIPYFCRGDVYRKLKDYERALVDYTQAIKLDPTDAIYYNRRGLVYDDLEQYEQAIADFSHAIKLDPVLPSFLSPSHKSPLLLLDR